MTNPSPADAAKRPLAQLPTWLHVSDLQGLAQLATQGTLGVAELAETVQGNVYKAVAAPFGPLGAKFVDAAPGSRGVKKTGITGLVYGSIKGVTRLASGGVNAVLTAAAPLAGRQASSPQREAMLSALNGALGDHLSETGNPLAIGMSLRQGGETLPLDRQALTARLPAATGKVLVLVHGLCMNDLQWGSESPLGSHNHGEALARELGYTPVYLHYNTGQHISTNGQQFAALLEQLWQAWPQPIEGLTLLAHSMGGLVSRSACHHGEQAGHRWRKGLKNLVFLGTPHHGAPLEALGNWVDTLLGGTAVTRPFAQIGQLRSAGITDLRHGNVLDADWQGTDRFERAPDARQLLPLPEGVACFAVAGTTMTAGSGALAPIGEALSQKIIGDGLVPLASALGQHEDPSRNLAFAPKNQRITQGVIHMQLLSRPEVNRQLLHWLREPVSA